MNGGLLDYFMDGGNQDSGNGVLLHPKNLLLEYNIGVYYKTQRFKEIYNFPLILWKLADAGYKLRRISRKTLVSRPLY